jgi:mannose-6-phosphate isomerase-like protein (cupin superfamily)
MEGGSTGDGTQRLGDATAILPEPGLTDSGEPVILGPEVTAGAYRVMVGTVPADYEPPPLHVHPHTDEAFYVGDGELTVVLEDREVVAGPGAMVFIPRGTVHTARNSGDGPMRGVILISPGDAEHVFAEPGS